MIEIAGRPIGPGNPCYIIAEAGVAHMGRIDVALRLVDAAKGAGADAVKFQTWKTERLLTPDSPMYRTLLPLELGEGQFRAIKEHCDEVGITFLSTPDQEEDADFLDELVPAFKIGSGNMGNWPFIQHVAKKGKPMIISTGMAAEEDVRAVVTCCGSTQNRQIALLHCASIYPKAVEPRLPDPEPWNLRAVETLKQFGYPVGYSDHSRMTAAAVAAVTLGASIYEAHLALDHHGPDAGVSLNEEAFRWVVDSIRWTERALGDGVKRMQPGEEPTAEYVRTWRRQA